MCYKNLTVAFRSSNDEAMVKAAFCPNLDEMLPLCDYVIISVKLTPQTHKLFGADQFRLMKSTAILVNVSRGKSERDGNDLDVNFGSTEYITFDNFPNFSANFGRLQFLT